MVKSIYASFCIFLVFIPGILHAQNAPTIKPPKIGTPRYLEDYSSFTNIEKKNLYQSIKFIPLGQRSNLSLGADIRFRYEYFKNYLLGLAPQDSNGYLLSRYLLYFDLKLFNKLRIFTQFQLSTVNWRSPGPRGIDRDLGDINQLFVEFPITTRSAKLFFRAGRQEITFGSNRILDYREGPNSRLAFDGLLINYLKKRINISLFYLAPVKIKPYSFDNVPEHEKKIIGIYSSLKNNNANQLIDIYLLYNEFPPERNYLTSNEKRITLGSRYYYSRNFTVDVEPILQLANVSNRYYYAYACGFDIKYPIIKKNEFLTAGIYSFLASGKSNQNTITYQSLYPTYNTFRTIELYGKYNLGYIEPYVLLKPLKKDRLILESIFYWRTSIMDNIYNSPGFIIIKADEIDGKYLGTQLNLIYTYYWNDFFQSELGYRVLLLPDRLKKEDLLKNINYFSFSLTFRI
jgi:hypothetical protein